MRTSLLLASLVLTFAPSAYALDYIKIAVWNIENLGTRTPPQRPADLAQYFRQSGADVLGLSEIHDNDDEGSTRTNDALDTAFALMNEGDGQEWKYAIFQNKQAGDTSQLCGVAWNAKRVTMDGEAFKIPVEDDPDDTFNSWDRHPHAVKFKTKDGKSDFVLIPIHMKSNVGGPAATEPQREFEAQALVDKLPAVRSNFGDEQDIVILGDSNALRADEPCCEVYKDAGFVDLNASDAQTFRTGAPFDRIFVPDGQEETRFSRQYVVRPTDIEDHDTFLSDHFMVMTTLRVLDDDD